MTSPLAAYRQRLETGAIRPDPAQEAAIARLDALAQELASWNPNAWFSKRGAPRGMYLWGPVGRGKSLLLDLFFEAAPVKKKRRVHFHEFMLARHAFLRDARGKSTGQDELIAQAARQVAEEAQLLCFDEIQVTDIADAMILGRLFSALFEAGVVVIATSNRPPRDLYKNGLQRELFVPFIELFEQRLDVLHLNSPTDYRLRAMRTMNVYMTPLDQGTEARLRAYFARLTRNADAGGETLDVNGRRLEIPMASDDCAYATFSDLCAKPLGAADYLAIASRYDVLFLSRIPKMNAQMRNEAKRFVTLIDALYEHKVKLICSAERPAEELYTEGDGAFEFERTISRLHEMQSEGYLGAAHLS